MSCGTHKSQGCCDDSCCCDERCDCGCQNDGAWMGFTFRRRFQTKAEQIAELECYLEELRAEVQAVEERIADLKK